MTSIRGHPDLNCWGGGEGQGVWTLHLKYLWLSLPIPFLQWFHSLCPKMFLKFSRFPQPQDVSFPPSLFPPLFKSFHPPVSTNPVDLKSQAKTSYYKFKFWHFKLSGWKSFNVCHVLCIFFLCPKHVTKTNYHFFCQVQKSTFFLISSLCFINLINLTIMDWIFGTW